MVIHGEAAVYRPRGVEADDREIRVIVDRREFTSDETGEQTVLAYSIRAIPSETTGILAKEVDAGSDRVLIYLRDGDEEMTEFRIVGQPTLNGGMIRLRIR